MSGHTPWPWAKTWRFVEQVMKLFADADLISELWWRFDDDQITLFAMVSDMFTWATADAEEITPTSFPELRQAYDDLAAIGETGWLCELYAARRRGMRPQGAAYPEAAAAQALFDACGPEREVGLDNPKAPPEPTDEVRVAVSVLNDLIKVAGHVSRGRSFADEGKYPDALARRALGALDGRTLKDALGDGEAND